MQIEQMLNQKLELVQKLYDITTNMNKVDIEDNLDEFNSLSGDRQKTIDKLNILNKTIEENKSMIEKNDVNTKLINQINLLLKNIMDMDYQINKKLTSKKMEIRKKIADIDRDIDLKRYAVDNTDVKEKGHFIEFRG